MLETNPREKYLDDRNLNREQRRALEKAYREIIQSYPEKFEELDRNDPRMPYSSHAEDLDHVFINKRFTVQQWKPNQNGQVRLMVHRNTWSAKEGRWYGDITWDELMEIKRELGYGEIEGFEILPKDSEIYNLNNCRHLWLNFKETDNIPILH